MGVCVCVVMFCVCLYAIMLVDCVIVNEKGVLVSPVWVDFTITVTNGIAQPSLFDYDI